MLMHEPINYTPLNSSDKETLRAFATLFTIASVRGSRAYDQITLGRLIESAFRSNPATSKDQIIHDLTQVENEYRQRAGLAESPDEYQAYSHEDLYEADVIFEIASGMPGLSTAANVARKAFKRLAESAALRGRFNNDANSEQFWRMLEADQQNEWGAAFDVRGHCAQNVLAPMFRP